jgi:hypothetical protein
MGQTQCSALLLRLAAVEAVATQVPQMLQVDLVVLAEVDQTAYLEAQGQQVQFKEIMAHLVATELIITVAVAAALAVSQRKLLVDRLVALVEMA